MMAENGRDFAGFYDCRDLVVEGENIRAKFSAWIVNYSGQDVFDARVVLESALFPINGYGAFEGVAVLYRQGVLLRDLAVTIPWQELERWAQGVPLMLTIEYRHSSGSRVKAAVEISHMPLPEEK